MSLSNGDILKDNIVIFLNSKKKILIKTAGGRAPKKELGLGHIYRTINLSKNFKNTEIFFLVEDFGGASRIVKNNFKNVIKIEKDISYEKDIRITKEIITKKKIDILIIDKYKIKNKFVKEISKDVRTVVITDLNNIQYSGDLIINGFIGFKNQITYNKFKTKCLLGPKYQILNNTFGNIDKKNTRKEIDILATFGGFDENNILEKIAKEMDLLKKTIRIKIILGPATKIKPSILRIKKKYKKNFQIIQKTADMHSEILKSRYGICGGGITAYEFAACNIPFAIISQVRHQVLTANEMEKQGLAVNLGLVGNQTPKKIREFLEQILERPHNNPKKKIIDGKGSSRVSKEILRLK